MEERKGRMEEALEVLKRRDYNLFLIKHTESEMIFHVCNVLMHTPAMNIRPDRLNVMEDEEIARISRWIEEVPGEVTA
jgi:hypothetical protein